MEQMVVNMPSTNGLFGVLIEDLQVWKAHFHITLTDVTSEELMAAAKLIGAKCTTIDLHRDTRTQRDRMLTKYQAGIGTEKMMECVAKLQEAGYTVVRFKLEEMFQTISDLSERTLTKEKYGEVHIKTPASLPEIETGFFRISSNTEEVDYRFYNARLYNDEDKVKLLDAVKVLEQNGVELKSYHIEQVVVDSNYNLDAWWS